MSLRTSLREIKKEEADEFNGVFFQSLILFVPEESHIDKLDKKELVLLVNLTTVRRVDKEKHNQETFTCHEVRIGRRLTQVDK